MTNASNDFSALARQYWAQWGDALREGTEQLAGKTGGDAFQHALDGWAQAATGKTSGANDVLDLFRRQTGDWYGQLQQLAARFSGREHRASDVVQAWRDALGSNPFEQLMQGMRGSGMQGIAQWNALSQPWMQGMRGEAAQWLGVPAFGFAREHQERLQALGQAQLRWQSASDRYNALLANVSQAAYARFEDKLAEREEPGRQIDSVRALFDLWVDAAEEAWAKAALSLEYRHAFGELANAQMALRSAAQALGEKTAETLGLPGRTELDSAHRKIAELERQLRRRPPNDGAPAPAAQPAPKQPATKKPAVNKAAAKKAATKKAAAKKPTSQAVKPAPRKPAKPKLAKSAKSAKPTKTAGRRR